MALQNLAFNELYDSNNTSGRTRVNESGLIVGVDFSSTSNTIGTGSKTFTLAADLNVNRDWVVGGKVIVVDQVGGATMTGTVTTYTPSTQVLVLSIASVTGSGTGLTNWRIGSLDARRNFDPVTLLPTGIVLEGQATNFVINSEEPYAAADGGTTATVAGALGLKATRWVPSTQNIGHKLVLGTVPSSSGSDCYSLVVKSDGVRYVALNEAAQTGNSSRVFDLQDGVILENGGGPSAITPVGNGFFRIAWFLPANTAAKAYRLVALPPANPTGANPNNAPFVSDGVSAVLAQQSQVENAAGPNPTSYNPTTTTQVTRTAEILDVNPTRLAELFRQGEGTIYVEFFYQQGQSSYVFEFYNSVNLTFGRLVLIVLPNNTLLSFISTPSGSVSIGAGSVPVNAVSKVAYSFANGVVSTSINGADAVELSYAGAPEGITTAILGRSRDNVENFIGTYRKLGIRPNRISNANLKLISAGSLDFFQNGEIL